MAVVGRPNVGKSTLFNRLVGRREAIVLDRPGVTRDRLERPARLAKRSVMLVDSGGILPDAEEEILREVSRQALRAREDADVLVLVIDARAGVTPVDESLAGILRTSGKPVVVAANKVDVERVFADAVEAWRLGLGEPMPISAEHGGGVDELVAAIEALLPEPVADEPELARTDAPPDPADELHLAIVGRPNVGKSSLVNRLAGDERVTVSSRPGTTRDAVDVVLRREGRTIVLVDTAGIRRRAKVETKDESIGIMLGRRRLERAHVAVVVLDATAGVTSQDQGIVGAAIDAGRPIVLALNKWDLVEQPERRVEEIDDAIARRLAFAGGIPRVTLSALTGQRAFKVLDVARDVAELATRKISTSELNRFLERTLGDHLGAGGSAPKALYATQIGILPPTFVIFCRKPEKISASFRRFVERRIRETFGLEAIPVRISFRASPRRTF